MLPTTKVGTFTGNGGSNTVNLGFVPDFVKITSRSRNGGTLLMAEAFRGDSDGSAVLIAKQLGAGVNPASYLQHLDTGGINFRDGTVVESGGPQDLNYYKGFKVGSSLSLNGKVMMYLAIRSGAGLEGNS